MPPYQFQKNKMLQGIDIDLANLVLRKSDIKVVFKQKEWYKTISDTISGEQDLALGVTITRQRQARANFSVPYREERNALVTLTSTSKTLSFNSPNSFLMSMKSPNFRLGVIRGYVYVSPLINEYIAANDFLQCRGAVDCHKALKAKKIEGYLIDKMEATARFGNESNVRIQDLGVSTPISFMFNKKVPQDTIDKINSAIEAIKDSKDYEAVFDKYGN